MELRGKNTTFFRCPAVQNITSSLSMEGSLQIRKTSITQEIITTFSVLKWMNYHFFDHYRFCCGDRFLRQEMIASRNDDYSRE